MRNNRTNGYWIAAVLAFGIMPLWAPAGHAAEQGKTANQVVARVGESQITLAELRSEEAGKLLNTRYQNYLAERKALNDLIDKRLLDEEAKRRGLTVAQLLDKELKIKEPAEADLRVFYEVIETDQTYEAIRSKILNRLREIRRAKARAAYVASLRAKRRIVVMLEPPEARIDAANAARRGPSNAPVLLIEFADYQCPYCRRTEPMLAKLQERYSGKLAFAFKDLPLPNHQFAQKAAEAVRCAGRQGKFWQFHDALFRDENSLDAASLKALAQRQGLDGAQFNRCLDSGMETAAVAKDSAEARQLGLTGTPSFFINGHFVSGAVDYDTLKEIIEGQLVQAANTGSATPVIRAAK